jgi:hypothetical protein
MTQEEQDVVNLATPENFLGFDDKGSAIIRNASGQLQAYGGSDWTAVTDALKAKHGEKSFNDYIGNEQLKALGGEFQGIDEESGAAVFTKDGETFGIAKDDPDYKNLFNVAKNSAPAKTWFNPNYEKQFNQIQEKGTQFSGFDDQGNALFKNKVGQYETVTNKDAGFYKYAQKFKSDQKFQGVQGVSNAVKGENVAPIGNMNSNVASTSADANRKALGAQGGGFSRFSASSTTPGKLQNNAPSANQPTTVGGAKPPVNIAPPTTASAAQQQPVGSYNAQALNTGAKVKKAKAQPVQAPPSMSVSDIAVKMGKEYATNFANQKLAEVKTAAKEGATNFVKTATQPYRDLASGQIKEATGFDPSKSLSEQAAEQAGKATGVDSQYFVDPKNAAINQASSAINDKLGFDAVAAARDPKAYLKQQAEEQLSKQLGFNVAELAKDPKQFAINQGVNMLANYTGADAGTLAGAAGALFKGGNMVENAKEYAKEEAKRQAKQAALNQIASYYGVDANAVGGAYDVGKDVLKGGVSEDTARKAGETAARAAVMYYTGGTVTPENLELASNVLLKGYEGASNKFGTVGTLAAHPLKTYGEMYGAAGDILDYGIKDVGQMGADMYSNGKNDIGGLKMIAKGNIGDGISQIAKGSLDMVTKNIAASPVAAVKKIVSSVGSAVKNIFCFDGNTEILMEDGSYKKIKLIKLGDKIALGGLVTAIGQSASTEIYNYNGVKVAGGHAVFEDGKWVRVFDSKKGELLEGEELIVYPMSTEHHLIVTKDQIWADLLEVDDKQNKTEAESLKELNKQTVKNKMLKSYLKVKFGIS